MKHQNTTETTGLTIDAVKQQALQTTSEILESFANFVEGNYVKDDQQCTFDDVYNEPSYFLLENSGKH